MGGGGYSTNNPLGSAGPNVSSNTQSLQRFTGSQGMGGSNGPFGNPFAGFGTNSLSGGGHSYLNTWPTSGQLMNSASPFGFVGSLAKQGNLGSNAQAMEANPWQGMQHGLNTGTYLENQNKQAQNQAQTAGLMGSQYGNSLGGGGGGMGQHFSTMGFNQQLAQFAQRQSDQNSQSQSQALSGLMSALAIAAMFA